MMDPATQLFIQDLIRQQGRSMLQYVVESFPWTTPANEGLLPGLLATAAEERHAAEELAKLLLRHHGRPPFLGAYPMSFTTINFVALDHLLPRLVRFQEKRLNELSAKADLILHEETRSVVRSVVDLTRRHLDRLQDLAAGKRPPEEQPPSHSETQAHAETTKAVLSPSTGH